MLYAKARVLILIRKLLDNQIFVQRVRAVYGVAGSVFGNVAVQSVVHVPGSYAKLGRNNRSGLDLNFGSIF